MEPTYKSIAVISGDIVNSTKLTSDQFELLLKGIKHIQTWITDGDSSNAHSIERGDEFQSVVHDIENALRYTIIYRIGIKALGKEFDSRISFAIASNADLRESVSESMGKAFVLSGRGLKAMKSDRLVFNSDRLDLTEHFNLLFKYLDRQLTELTSRQCEVMLKMLQTNREVTINELAENLNVATATVSKSLKASGWPLISELNLRFINQVTGLKYV
ncbi:HTH domain-containing protein [Shewanella baltica]|uniref:HTH domain-containing protein n=1 Tax=Shewanella baltica TaxID=62322 RepID=UPI002871334D|nr:HTH domain-containing protein [Shewanella baltica]MDR9767205.1 HTH domain-containing protein [Shewanella baltica]